MAKRYHLVDKLNKIIEIYKDHRYGYDQIMIEQEKLRKDYDNLGEKYRFSIEQKLKASAELNEKKSKLDNDIKALRKSFLKECREVETEIEMIFGHKFKMHPEMIDNNVITALNADLYKGEELLELFEKYDTEKNMIMLRAVANKAEEKAENEPWNKNKLMGLNRKLNQISPTYKNITHGVVETCKRGMGARDDQYGRFDDESHGLAKGWANRFDEHIKPYMEQAENVIETL